MTERTCGAGRFLGLALAFSFLFLGPGRAGADERMNGMVGLYYSTYNGYSFEYDLILQFQKSKNWIGNMVGPFVSEEIGTRSNKFGLGFVGGKRMTEKGTYALSAAVFVENRWEDIGEPTPGAELKLSILVFGIKMGVMDWDGDRIYYQFGLSY